MLLRPSKHTTVDASSSKSGSKTPCATPSSAFALAPFESSSKVGLNGLWCRSRRRCPACESCGPYKRLFGGRGRGAPVELAPFQDVVGSGGRRGGRRNHTPVHRAAHVDVARGWKGRRMLSERRGGTSVRTERRLLFLLSLCSTSSPRISLPRSRPRARSPLTDKAAVRGRRNLGESLQLRRRRDYSSTFSRPSLSSRRFPGHGLARRRRKRRETIKRREGRE